MTWSRPALGVWAPFSVMDWSVTPLSASPGLSKKRDVPVVLTSWSVFSGRRCGCSGGCFRAAPYAPASLCCWLALCPCTRVKGIETDIAETANDDLYIGSDGVGVGTEPKLSY